MFFVLAGPLMLGSNPGEGVKYTPWRNYLDEEDSLRDQGVLDTVNPGSLIILWLW